MKQWCQNCGDEAKYRTAWFESVAAHKHTWATNPSNATHCLRCAKARAEVLNERRAS